MLPMSSVLSNSLRHAALLGLAAASFCSPLAGAADLVTAEPAHRLAGTKGRFDFIAIDSERHRLLAAHTGNGSVDVVDLMTGALIKAVNCGAAQDCAVDSRSRRYLVSVSKPPQLAVIDPEKLEVTVTVPLDGPADLLTLHPITGLAYVDHDDGNDLWVVSLEEKKVVARVQFSSEAPEDLAFDATGKTLFQAMKTAGVISVVDAASHRVTANWSTEPAKQPHGISMVPSLQAVAVAGGNGRLVLMSQFDGKILASAAMPERVDQIAFDAALNRLYCPSSLGQMWIFAVGDHRLEKLGEVTTPAGARSIAIDPATHAVWIAYAQRDDAFVQSFTVPK